MTDGLEEWSQWLEEEDKITHAKYELIFLAAFFVQHMFLRILLSVKFKIAYSDTAFFIQHSSLVCTTDIFLYPFTAIIAALRLGTCIIQISSPYAVPHPLT